MFLAKVDSAILANGLSAPQHSTYFVILLDGLERVGGPPGVALPVLLVVIVVTEIVSPPPLPLKLLFRSSDTFDNLPLTLPFCDDSLSIFCKQQKRKSLI